MTKIFRDINAPLLAFVLLLLLSAFTTVPAAVGCTAVIAASWWLWWKGEISMPNLLLYSAAFALLIWFAF